MGKGKRNCKSKFRVILRSPEYMRKKRELEVRKRAMRAGEIFVGEMEKEELALNRIPGKLRIIPRGHKG